jgi:retron-type reverse transcriptase
MKKVIYFLISFACIVFIVTFFLSRKIDKNLKTQWTDAVQMLEIGNKKQSYGIFSDIYHMYGTVPNKYQRVSLFSIFLIRLNSNEMDKIQNIKKEINEKFPNDYSIHYLKLMDDYQSGEFKSVENYKYFTELESDLLSKVIYIFTNE